MKHRIPWNRHRAVGPRTHLEAVEVRAVAAILADRRSSRDLALFMTAVDTMLRASDLLALRVADVTTPDGRIRERLQLGQKKSRRAVFPALTVQTREALAHWIEESGKHRSDTLFTAIRAPHGEALSASHYRDLVKGWVEAIGLDPANYSSHSLRRTKPVWLWRHGDRRSVTITALQLMLGHASPRSTVQYLGLDVMEAQGVALAHDIFRARRWSPERSDSLSDADITRIAKAVVRQLKE